MTRRYNTLWSFYNTQGRNFLVAVQLFEDRTANEQRVEGLLTLILEDRNKNTIEDWRVGQNQKYH